MTEKKDPIDEFNYLFAEQKEYCVISFLGAMNKGALVPLEECAKRVQECDGEYFVLNFREVPSVEKRVYRHLVKIQNVIRGEKISKLKVCGVNPNIKSLLIDDGIIRENEIVDNTKVALRELIHAAGNR